MSKMGELYQEMKEKGRWDEADAYYAEQLRSEWLFKEKEKKMKVKVCYTTYVDDSYRKAISRTDELATRDEVKMDLERFGTSNIEDRGETYKDDRKDTYPLITKILNMWK